MSGKRQDEGEAPPAKRLCKNPSQGNTLHYTAENEQTWKLLTMKCAQLIEENKKVDCVLSCGKSSQPDILQALRASAQNFELREKIRNHACTSPPSEHRNLLIEGLKKLYSMDEYSPLGKRIRQEIVNDMKKQ